MGQNRKCRSYQHNPNRVAPLEIELLEVSIREDNLRNQSSYYNESANRYIIVEEFYGNILGSITEDIRGKMEAIYLLLPSIKASQRKKFIT
jgi:hypothetical protein